jgi:hypothetical protein
MIRQLRAGEKLPEGEPRRYKAGHGYVRLRWYLGDRQWVEAYEHRVEGNHVTTAQQVHHRNHRRDDNAPENLERLTAEEHWQRHGSTVAEAVIALYQQGHGTPYIATVVGREKGGVYRMLQRRGLIDSSRARGRKCDTEAWLTFREDVA